VWIFTNVHVCLPMEVLHWLAAMVFRWDEPKMLRFYCKLAVVTLIMLCFWLKFIGLGAAVTEEVKIWLFIKQNCFCCDTTSTCKLCVLQARRSRQTSATCLAIHFSMTPFWMRPCGCHGSGMTTMTWISATSWCTCSPPSLHTGLHQPFYVLVNTGTVLASPPS